MDDEREQAVELGSFRRIMYSLRSKARGSMRKQRPESISLVPALMPALAPALVSALVLALALAMAPAMSSAPASAHHAPPAPTYGLRIVVRRPACSTPVPRRDQP